MMPRDFDCPPVIFLVFNRPDHTRRVFERIREARPPQLYVVADGPRPNHPTDTEKCQQVRSIIEEVDWKCDVTKDYSDANLGCGVRVSTGITSGLNKLSQAVILEDDCLPSSTFFTFCGEMLDRHRNDTQVMQISGHCPLKYTGKTSYFYAYSGGIWGWATWARAWASIDFHLETLDAKKDKLRHACHSETQYQFWLNHIRATKTQSPPSTWAIQWYYSRLVQSGLSVIPRVNMIENVGFDDQATHTKSSEAAPLKAKDIRWPLRHPAEIVRDSRYDVCLFQQTCKIEMPELSCWQWLRYGVRNRLRKWLLIRPSD